MLIEDSLLTHDERKAAEAAFRGLPLDAQWSRGAQTIYIGILEVTRGRDIVGDDLWEEVAAAV
ncbi:MAG TPA: hypothetical protein PLY42_13665 [Nitrospira sp.]|nr:hypothetical protein [Nitrospira sp.]MBX7040153.1 hypothetical protein [Nitrospira sp.]MCW5796532.1 hypothetical protein [Nitrospira sp.]HMU30875.1 hypothetical protein [Nitrospira sp.]HMV57927.1 hypothetical protein [Nitrospira sp.]